jgi:hypothetical protein
VTPISRQQSIERFAHVATIFAKWALQREDTGEIAARNSLRHIAELYLAALDLPEPAAGAELADDQVGKEEWKTVYATCARLTIDYYGEVFDPLIVPPQEAVVGSVADDIADIYRDVVTGLRHYLAGDTEDAIWQWTFSFTMHWGAHATGAIRALHASLSSFAPPNDESGPN